MEPITITDEYLAEVRECFEKWANFLNISFGLVAFGFVLACLGTKTPVINAWLSIVVLVLVRYKENHLFLLKLRDFANSLKLIKKLEFC